MSSYRSSDDSQAKLVANLILLGIALVFYLWFYSAKSTGEGVITSKWTETHTSCDDDGCITSTDYLVQFEDGTILSVFWGNRDWDRMVVGSRIRYEARGRDINFLGWRVMQPDIFSFEVLEGPPGH